MMPLFAEDTARNLRNGDTTMTPTSKMDFKKIKDAINFLGRDDMRTRLTTKVGDNPANVDATLTLIENLCAVIRQQEGLVVEEISAA
jgi:hypothetical protein